MKINKSTPILIVDSIERNLDFWVDRMGYKKTVEVPHGNSLGFAILERDGLELMLQTKASLAEDLPEIARRMEDQAVIQYLDIDSIADVLERLKGVRLLVGPRETFYGSKEIYLEDPSGHLIGFAEKTKG